MQKVQQGFTLIELMIVVAIIGILASVALPAYQGYTIRSQVTEGINLAAEAKTAVADFRAVNGTWPTSNALAGLSAANTFTGSYTSSVEVASADAAGANATVTITYSNGANAKIAGDTIILTASESGAGGVTWVCTGGDLASEYRPASCRPNP